MSRGAFAKCWLRSKTILFNLALVLVGSWTAVEASLGNLKAALTPAQYGVLMASVGIVGVLLRLVTTRPVTARSRTRTGTTEADGT